MKMNIFQNKFIWLGVFSVGVFLIVFSIVRNNFGLISEPVTSSPSINPSVKPTSAFSAKPLPDKTPIITKDKMYLPSPPPRDLITGPATCQLSGSIEFKNENLYETKGAKIAYQNVDDPVRLIFWKIAPDNGVLKVGPNAFSQFSNFPNGEKEIGVSLSKPATVKSYILSAAISYGIIKPDGAEEVRNANCTGSIMVELPYLP